MRLLQLWERLAGRVDSDYAAPSQDMFVKSDVFMPVSANDNRRKR